MPQQISIKQHDVMKNKRVFSRCRERNNERMREGKCREIDKRGHQTGEAHHSLQHGQSCMNPEFPFVMAGLELDTAY
jgi:hypothetical protein